MKLVQFLFHGGTITVQLSPGDAERLLKNWHTMEVIPVVTEDGQQMSIAASHLVAVSVVS